MQVELVESPDALPALRPLWERLWAEDGSAEVFGRYEWFLSWWKHFGGRSGPAVLVTHQGDEQIGVRGRVAAPHVLVVREGDRPVALLPWVQVEGRWRRWPTRILSPPVNAHAWRGTLVCTVPPSQVLGAVAEHLAARHDWDMVLVDGDPGDSELTSRLLENGAVRGLPGRIDAPWSHSYLGTQGSWDEYLAAKSRHFRKRLRRAESALEEVGKVAVRCFRTPVEVEEGMGLFEEIDAQSWKATGGESFALEPTIRGYYSDLAGSLALAGSTRLWILSLAEEPAAAFLCFTDKRLLYTAKSSYKEKFGSNRLAPSFVLMGRVIRSAFEEGLLGVDMAGRVPFLERWGSESRRYARLLLFRGRGRFALARAGDLASTLVRARHRLRSGSSR